MVGGGDGGDERAQVYRTGLNEDYADFRDAQIEARRLIDKDPDATKVRAYLIEVFELPRDVPV